MQRISDDYAERMTNVVKYIDDHLDADLSIAALADIAHFSKFHFHRIFKGAMGETVNAYVNRRRLERAAVLLKRRPDLGVTEVALQVGFQSPEHFSRLFKDKFGATARDLRNSDPEDPDSLKNRKIYQELSEHSFYHVYQQSRKQPSPSFEVIVRQQPEYMVATISDTFGKDGMPLVNAYNELIAWARDNNLFDAESKRFAVSRDDIETVPAEQYRLEFSIRVPSGTKTSGRVVMDQIWGGLYAIIPVQGDIQRVAQAWDYLYKEWLPTSSYVPVDAPAIEIFLQGPETIGWEKFDLEIGVPIQKQSRKLT
ncbi:MAG: GyrI-like domain-containing protein [Planctomycetota bacterium]